MNSGKLEMLIMKKKKKKKLSSMETLCNNATGIM